MTVKIFAAVLLLACFVAPISAQNAAGYTVKITAPSGAQNSTFEDDSIKINFPRETHLTFTLTNKTGQAIEIDWQKASFVDISGKSHRVIYDDIRLLEKIDALPPTVIPVAGKRYATVVPAEFVSNDAQAADSWKVRGLFAGGMEAYVGKPFSLRLPVKFGGETREYVFTFVVEKVEKAAQN